MQTAARFSNKHHENEVARAFSTHLQDSGRVRGGGGRGACRARLCDRARADAAAKAMGILLCATKAMSWTRQAAYSSPFRRGAARGVLPQGGAH